MLNINELRDGNNIFDSDGKMIAVSLQTRLQAKESALKRQPDDFHGIPLTYKLLAQAIKGIKGANDISTKKAVHIELPIKLPANRYLCIYSNDFAKWLISIQDSGAEIPLRFLTYFHELQNLYLDIAGENLAI